jgi:hypothetical protein
MSEAIRPCPIAFMHTPADAKDGTRLGDIPAELEVLLGHAERH